MFRLFMLTYPPNPAILRLLYSEGYDDGPCCGEGDHHHSGEGSPSFDIPHGDGVEPRTAPTSPGAGVSQDFGCQSSTGGNGSLDASGPPFQTVYPPEIQQPSSLDILELLERHDGGRATCLWMHGGHPCGHSSQIDLVKRHIKRVHFRLR